MLQIWRKTSLLVAEPEVEYNTLVHFLFLAPFSWSDIPGLYFCIWGQTNLSLCGAECHNHATKGENMIRIVFREWEHNIAKYKTKVFFFFLFFSPSLQFYRHIDRFIKTESVHYSWYFENHYWHNVWCKNYMKVLVIQDIRYTTLVYFQSISIFKVIYSISTLLCHHKSHALKTITREINDKLHPTYKSTEYNIYFTLHPASSVNANLI